jgi:hypothetical protein
LCYRHHWQPVQQLVPMLVPVLVLEKLQVLQPQEQEPSP